MAYFLRTFLELFLLVASILVLARVAVSWVDPACRNDWSRRIVFLTEPVLRPVRQALPATGMLDLSPLVVLIVLGIVLRLVSL
jgi:YggT family protein